MNEGDGKSLMRKRERERMSRNDRKGQRTEQIMK